MSRAELEQVVGELGMSKALVARAAAELAVHDVRNQPVWSLGGKADLMFEEEVPGHVDEGSWTQMVEVLRRRLGEPGELTRDGKTRIWSTREGPRRVHLTVVELEASTTLRLEESMVNEARGIVGGSAFGAGFVGFMGVLPIKILATKLLAVLAMGPLALVGAGAGWAVGRAVWRRRAARREEDLRGAFAEILEVAERRSRMLGS